MTCLVRLAGPERWAVALGAGFGGAFVKEGPECQGLSIINVIACGLDTKPGRISSLSYLLNREDELGCGWSEMSSASSKVDSS